jgi:hypothetical protein
MKREVYYCKRRAFGFHAVLALALFTSCASAPVALNTVGPEPPVVHSTGGSGYLVVYSAAEAKRLDKGVPYYVHTSYLIKTPDGKTFKWVANHAGDMDETSQSASVPAGAYQVVAESEDYGRVRVPVVIEAGRTTEVHLEGKGSWKPRKQPSDDTDLVHFPDGEMVGWRELASVRSGGI